MDSVILKQFAHGLDDAQRDYLRHNYLKRTEAARHEADKRGVPAMEKVWRGLGANGWPNPVYWEWRDKRAERDARP